MHGFDFMWHSYEMSSVLCVRRKLVCKHTKRFRILFNFWIYTTKIESVHHMPIMLILLPLSSKNRNGLYAVSSLQQCWKSHFPPDIKERIFQKDKHNKICTGFVLWRIDYNAIPMTSSSLWLTINEFLFICRIPTFNNFHLFSLSLSLFPSLSRISVNPSLIPLPSTKLILFSWIPIGSTSSIKSLQSENRILFDKHGW